MQKGGKTESERVSKRAGNWKRVRKQKGGKEDWKRVRKQKGGKTGRECLSKRAGRLEVSA